MRHDQSLLIVENDLPLLDLLTLNFRQRGFAVTSVAHPRQALEAARVEAFDVALLDGSLPEQDGAWLTHELKLLDSRLQVIVLSAHSDEDFPTKCLANGAFAYLRKPCGLSELEETLHQALAARVATGETLRSAYG